ncbi:MAG: GumC family protein [Tepidisphaeraceae bacterium]
MRQQYITTPLEPEPQAPARIEDVPVSSLVLAVWNRRTTVLLVALASVLLGWAYLKVATPAYRATARLSVDEAAPRAFSDAGQTVLRSDSFANTQAAALQTLPVLHRALAGVQGQAPKTLAAAHGDPAEWLLDRGLLTVDTARKSDVIEVTLQSPDPREAAALANAIVDAFVAVQGEALRTQGTEMIASLRSERQSLIKDRATAVERMIAYQREHNTVSFAGDRSNLSRERVAELSQRLTEARVQTMDLRAQRNAIQSAIRDPAALPVFVESLKSESREWGHTDYEDLKRQERQYEVTLAANGSLASNNPRSQQIQLAIQSAKTQIARIETNIAQGRLVLVSSQLQAAEDKEAQLALALAKEQEQALAVAGVTADFGNLAAEVQRLQSRCDAIDNRIEEINVNNMAAKPATLQIMERATVPTAPATPNAPLTFALALMLGLVGGMSVALIQDWRDTRLKSAGEIGFLTDLPVLGMIPRVQGRFSPSERGQLVCTDPRSAAAEAYREVRTTLQLGKTRHAKTILFVSPASADGKSTTASNVAIAFAQAGERTLLIDCDLRHAVQHHIFRVPNRCGISGILSGKMTLDDAIMSSGIPNLALLTSGMSTDAPAELLATEALEPLLKSLRRDFDRIIIDAPPVIGVTDARILAAMADATVLVLRMRRSIRELGVWSIDALGQVNARLAGVVANDVPARDSYGQPYASSWQYSRPHAIAGRLQHEAHASPDFVIAPAARANGHEVPSEPGDDASHFSPPDAAIYTDIPDHAGNAPDGNSTETASRNGHARG